MFASVLYKIFILVLFLLSLPLAIIIAVQIVITTGFPILYHQKRVGKDGIVFWIIKFRTMKPDADKRKKNLRKYNEAQGPVFKMYDDPRLTFVGKILSHTGLDEIPQLFNVLKGDMALFGPRPLPIEEASKLKKWQQKRHAIKPGIISPWIVNGYHSNSFDQWIRSDIEYSKQKSVSYDFKLLLKVISFLYFLQKKEIIRLLKIIAPDNHF